MAEARVLEGLHTESRSITSGNYSRTLCYRLGTLERLTELLSEGTGKLSHVVKDPRQVTPAEFAIIEVLWAHPQDLPVSAVKQELAPRRNLAYTTVMTLLDKMRRKGSVKRKKRGKAYYYSPTVKRQEVLNFMVQQFANSYCHGSRHLLEPFIQERRVSVGARLRMNAPTGHPDLDVELL